MRSKTSQKRKIDAVQRTNRANLTVTANAAASSKGNSESIKTVRAEPVEAPDVAGDALRQAQGERIGSAFPKQ
jgi:hypothetical protein